MDNDNNCNDKCQMIIIINDGMMIGDDESNDESDDESDDNHNSYKGR